MTRLSSALAVLVSAVALAAPVKVGLIGQGAQGQAQVQAFADFVKRTTGQEAAGQLFADYDGLANAIAGSAVDVALVPPIAFLRAEAKSKPQALLTLKRKGQTTYRSVLFVASGSKVKSLADLKAGKNLKAAWVDSSSATGYIFPKALLAANKIDPAQLFVSQDFLGSHDAACAAVSAGKADLGATFSDDGSHASGCGSAASQVRVIAASQNIPNDALVVRAGFPDATRDALVKAASGLASTPEGQKTLQAAFLGEGFAPTSAADYAPVRQALDAFRR